MIVLCDVNSMYSNCEKVFDHSIRNKPVIVLTNNDGCVCAACGIAKKMGIGKKFVPYFQIKDELEKVGAVVRSSNYELYADLSQRFMDVCFSFAPYSHVYSIDECFLSYGTGYIPTEGWLEHLKSIRRTVWKNVRLPIGVGAGLTPTLAKAANHASKRIDGYNGVAIIDSESSRFDILSRMDVTDVWGIGGRTGKRLHEMGIHNAWQLSKANTGLIKKLFSSLIESTVLELNGIVKFSWDDVRAPKKEIYSSRSFGKRINEKQILRQAIAYHVSIAARKLRKQNGLAKVLQVFAGSSPHDSSPYYRKALTHTFPAYTSDTQIIANSASRLVDLIYKDGVSFYRCGVGLLDLTDKIHQQQDLFSPSYDNNQLMNCLDKINNRFGRDSVHIASQGFQRKFAMRRQFLSPQYTTKLSDLPVFNCI